MTNSDASSKLVSGNDPRDVAFINQTLADLSDRQKLMLADAINYVERLDAYGRDAHNLTMLVYALFKLLRDSDFKVQDLTTAIEAGKGELQKYITAYDDLAKDRASLAQDLLSIGDALTLENWDQKSLEAFYRRIESIFHGGAIAREKEAEQITKLRKLSLTLYTKLQNINQVLSTYASVDADEAIAEIERQADLTGINTGDLKTPKGEEDTKRVK